MGERATFFLRLFELLGEPLQGPVLDFGCGKGDLVRDLRRAGIEAYGCDFPSELGDDPLLTPIGEPYRLPYPAAHFRAVVSNEVFEHVMDYPQAFREIRRVLAPDGASLHFFPGRYRPREPHTFVPLATVLRTRWWLRLWATLGVRNQFQLGKPASEVAELNYAYLKDHTMYLPRRRVLALARREFPRARLLEVERLTVSGNSHVRRAARLAQRAPALAIAFCEIYGERPLWLSR